VLRVADACAAVEDAVLLAVTTGKSKNYINQAVDICLQGISMWEQGNLMVGRFQLPSLDPPPAAVDRCGSVTELHELPSMFWPTSMWSQDRPSQVHHLQRGAPEHWML
jgi:hypothetical protein